MIIWKEIKRQLDKGNRLVLLVVVSHSGSSPGKQGFKMLVSEDGYIFGSIGGGRTEFSMVEKARELLKTNPEFAPFFVNQVHRDDNDDASGMICAGEQLVLFYPLLPGNISIIDEILEANQGVLTINKHKILFDKEDYLTGDFYFVDIAGSWKYSENINRKSKIYIVGGGHVALAVSKIFSTLDFDITVFESRKNINTFEQNSFAHKKLIIDYKDISRYIDEGDKSYIVILTHGYHTDKLILEQLLNGKYRYIGMLGSKYKVNQTMMKLKKQGIDESKLKNIDAPVGISIGSKTPPEIAVSIAAKIIKIKNNTSR